MYTEEVLQAVAIEVESRLSPGWSVSRVGDHILVVGPGTDSHDFRSTVWRLAEFIAYDDYVCIERLKIDSNRYHYSISSRSSSGLAFQVLIQPIDRA